MLIDHLNAKRHKLAWTGTLALGLSLLLIGRPDFQTTKTPVRDVMELAMAVIAPPPEPPLAQPRPPTPQAVTPPALKQQELKPLTVPPKAQTLAAQASPEPSPTAPLAAESTTKHSEQASPIASAHPAPTPTEPVRAPPVVVPAAPPPPPPIASNPEGAFTALLRAQINASKRYPTGRDISLQRPKGKVVVWFTLLRSGTVQDAGIEDSSDSIALDQAALSTVRRASFPSFPDTAWPDQASHKFTATLDFLPPS